MLPKVKSRQIQRKGDHSRDRPFRYLLFTFNRSIFDNWKKFCSEIPPSPEILAHFEFIFFFRVSKSSYIADTHADIHC